MSAPEITVAIPVGPSEANRRWLPEALDSIRRQTLQPAEVLIIDDRAHLTAVELLTMWASPEQPLADQPPLRVWQSPWRLGVAHAFNMGVGCARHPLVFLMGSDDWLEPDCLEMCVARWERNNYMDAYYYIGLRYHPDGELQSVPCGYAMVTRGLWDYTGGFPIESAVGAPDAALISIMMVHLPDRLILVDGGRPLVNYRRHDETDTASRGPWQGPILQTRNILTELWQPVEGATLC